jgi:hypothetical protein
MVIKDSKFQSVYYFITSPNKVLLNYNSLTSTLEKISTMQEINAKLPPVLLVPEKNPHLTSTRLNVRRALHRPLCGPYKWIIF